MKHEKDWMKFIRFLLFGISFCLCQFEQIAGEADATTSVEDSAAIQGWKIFNCAEESYQATLFSKAIEEYRRLFDHIEVQKEPSELLGPVCCRLGQAYIFQDDFESAYPYLERANVYLEVATPRFQEFKEQASYLYAFTCRHLKKHALAVSILKKHLQSPCPSTSESALFELALNTFLLNELNSAKEQFSALMSQSADPHFSLLAALYLTRIHLAEGDPRSAALCLEFLTDKICKGHPLYVEMTYLQGETAFSKHAYSAAIEHFQKILPQRNKERAPWLYETLYYLGWSHLKVSAEPVLTEEEQKFHLDEAERCFCQLMEKHPEERTILALAHCYLTKGLYTKDAELYLQAGEILSQFDSFKTLEAKTHALLLRAEAASIATPFDAAAVSSRSSELFLHAAEAFGEAYALLKEKDKVKAALALKSQIKAYQRCNTFDSLEKASEVLKNHLDQNSQDLTHELYYLYAVVACRLAEERAEDPERSSHAERIVREALKKYPNKDFSDACLKLLAVLYLNREQFASAEQVFYELVELYPDSPHAGDALYWGTYCAEKLGRGVDFIQKQRKQLFENYPSSPFAATAYFNYYSYRQYLQGDRAAIKHLGAFKDKFPHSPLQITAYYLRGLDYNRERKSAEGRSIRKKNLIKAIDHFFKAETRFDLLYKQKSIDEGQMPYLVMIRYCALLERALANQAVAEDSSAAKRAIYLQYAQELFMQINREMVDSNHPIASYLTKAHVFPKVQQESLYYLTQSYIKSGNTKAAERAIEQILAKYTSLGITKNYILSCIHYEKGMMLMREGKYEVALEAFRQAEQSDQGSFLSVNQKLDLWIQQSMCYKALYQTDQAMLILSKVINDNTVSSLRVKAMFLRAEVYALQGRHELARKQLEATAKKGGEWAIKAKNKLDEEYGTH